MRAEIPFVILVAVLSTAIADSATIIERELELRLDRSGFDRLLSLEVAIEEEGDLKSWGDYSVFVDEHIELVDASFVIIGADGRPRESIKQREMREETSVGFGLHTSSSLLIADFPILAVGERLRIKVHTRCDPIYLGYWTPVLTGSRQGALRIVVKGSGHGLRWELRGADDLVSVSETESGIVITGSDLPLRDPPDWAGDSFTVAPALHLAWDAASTWQALGGWYSRLTAELAQSQPQVKVLVEELTDGLQTPRERLFALADYARKQVRYEAVEVGVGGWVPTPAHEVLERGWGDCKDKSELLKELLAAAGLRSHLVLIHLGRERQIDANFPTTQGFNHCIVAVEADQIELQPGDPVVEGLFFLDPTMDRGAANWLSPYVHGQWALIAAGAESRLVKLPVRFREEGRGLGVAGRLEEDGNFAGTARLVMAGFRALPWVRAMDREAPERIAEAVHQYLQRELPGATVTDIRWQEKPGPVPTVVVDAAVSLHGLVRGTSRRRLRLGFLETLPTPRDLDGRDEPVVVWPGVQSTEWLVEIPEGWCVPDNKQDSLSNSIGRFDQQITGDELGRLVVKRTLVVHRSWIGTESLAQLEELAVIEAKSGRGSLRLSCPDESVSPLRP